jgi:hypothetical protein
MTINLARFGPDPCLLLVRFVSDCPWVCNCVGKRNYRYFVGFLFMVCVLDVFILFFSIFLIAYTTRHEFDGSFVDAVSTYPFALVESLVAFVFLWCLGSLFGYHFFLILHNLTTNEYIKRTRAERAPTIPTFAHADPSPLQSPMNGPGTPHPHQHRPHPSSQHHSNGVGAHHQLSADHRADLSSDHPRHTACCYTCNEFLCAPVPPSRFNLEAWITYDQVAIQHQQQQQQQRSISPQSISPHVISSQDLFDDEFQRSRYEYDQRQQQQVYDQQFRLQLQRQREADEARAQVGGAYPPPHMSYSPTVGMYAATPQLTAITPSASPYTQLSVGARSASLPLSPTGAGLLPSESSTRHERDSLIQQTRARAAQVERESQDTAVRVHI